MKKFLFLLPLLAAALLFTACGGATDTQQAPNVYRQINEKLANLQNFRARATVTYVSNHGSNTYETLQHALITGPYRVEVTGPERVAGNVTSFDGQHLFQLNTRVNGSVTLLARENRERSEMLLTAFIRNWQSAQESAVSAASMEDGHFTILEAAVPGNHPYLATQRVWIDNRTLLPTRLVILDPAGTERVIVSYEAFEYNVELDETIFTVSSHSVG